MAGDLLLVNLDEEELNALLTAGGTLVPRIFHADKYGQDAWTTWAALFKLGVDGNKINNRVGLPPHFYVNFSYSKINFEMNSKEQKAFREVVFGATRPLTIVSSNPYLAGWDEIKDPFTAVKKFLKALKRTSVTLEVYSYEGEDLIDRTSNEVHESLSYMELLNE